MTPVNQSFQSTPAWGQFLQPNCQAHSSVPWYLINSYKQKIQAYPQGPKHQALSITCPDKDLPILGLQKEADQKT